MTAGWVIERWRGSAATFHGRPTPDPAPRAVWRLDVEGPSLVVGSAQPWDDVDHAAARRAGVEVVRRRSGGGAVLLEPEAGLWLDVIVPTADPLWRRDVGVAFHWLGEVWVAALAEFGLVAAMHRGPLLSTRWSPKVCFAGLGPGEVTIDGRKIVGLSQRRTRHAARFQSLVLQRWEPAGLLTLLALDDAARADARRELAGVAGGVDVPIDELAAAFLRHLS